MDRFFSLLQTTTSCCKWSKIWLGSGLSGVPQGTVLGPLFFSLYINDISSDIESEIRLFADDCVCYREIKDEKRHDETSEGYWSIGFLGKEVGYEVSTCQMQYDAGDKKTDQEDPCFIYLPENLYSCPQEVKEAAYKGLVRPVLDYGSSVWDPPGVVLQEELESVQKRAARFVTGNYNYETGSMTGILGQLKWESLKKRRKDNRLILLYKGLKGKASVPTDDLIPKTRRCRNQHSMAFQTPIANTDVYKGSFFPQTIMDWNALPDSLISSAEDAEDCVAKFTSLVRARD